MKIRITSEKIIDASGLSIIAVDDSWCIKINTAFGIDGKNKLFLQATKKANLAARETKKYYTDILNFAYENDKLDCASYNLELIDVIEEGDDNIDGTDKTVLSAAILRTEEILTNEFFNCMDRCSKLEKENKPLQLLGEIGVLRGLNYSLATCNITLDDSTQKQYLKFMKLQEQLRLADKNSIN